MSNSAPTFNQYLFSPSLALYKNFEILTFVKYKMIRRFLTTNTISIEIDGGRTYLLALFLL